MEYILGTAAGFLIGAVVAWLVATQRAQSKLTSKLEEADRRAAAAETKAAAAEATATELRKQYDEIRQKTNDELQQLRVEVSSERDAKVRAETEK